MFLRVPKQKIKGVLKSTESKKLHWRQNLDQLIAGLHNAKKWAQTVRDHISPTMRAAYKAHKSCDAALAEVLGLPIGDTGITVGDVVRRLRAVGPRQNLLFPTILTTKKLKIKFKKVSNAVNELNGLLTKFYLSLKGNKKTLEENRVYAQFYRQIVDKADKMRTIYKKKIITTRTQSIAGGDTSKLKALTVWQPPIQSIFDIDSYWRKFHEFCALEFSTENPAFVKAVNDLEKSVAVGSLSDAEIRMEMTNIYNEYVRIDSDKYINIAGAQRTALINAAGNNWNDAVGNVIDLNVKPNPWSKAKYAVRMLFQHDTIPRFYRSPQFAQWRSTTDGKRIYQKHFKDEEATMARLDYQNDYDLHFDGFYDSYQVPAIHDSVQYQLVDHPVPLRSVDGGFHFYDPTLIILGVLVFFVFICCAVSMNIGVCVGSYIFGRYQNNQQRRKINADRSHEDNNV